MDASANRGRPNEDAIAGGAQASHPEATDAHLVERISRGDERALGHLFDRWSDRVYSLALFILGEESAAEDVVTTTFWQVWLEASQYDPGRGRAGSWLVMIARARALDRLRSDRRRSGFAGRLLQQRERWIGTAVPDPHEQAEQGERRRRVATALESLPPEQREVLELAYFQGLTQREIAEATREPLGTAKSRIRLALAKLKDHLSLLWEGDR